MRRVVLICGPPGAGKSSYARSLGLPTYDVDEPQWGDERAFRSALQTLGQTPDARAAVIRGGATLTARSKAAAIIGATDVQVITTDSDTCIQRIIERKQPRPSLKAQIAAVRDWWARYEPGPVNPALARKPVVQRTAARGYGAKHKLERSKAKRQVDAGRGWCWRCGGWINPSESWDLGHDDQDRSLYRGPEHTACNRSTASRHKPRRWKL